MFRDNKTRMYGRALLKVGNVSMWMCESNVLKKGSAPEPQPNGKWRLRFSGSQVHGPRCGGWYVSVAHLARYRLASVI